VKTVLVVCLVLIAIAAIPTNVKADSTNSAVVIKNDGACGMPGSDANGNLIAGGLGQVTTDVTNNNQQMLSCKGTDITNLSGQGQHFSGFLCGTFAGPTTDSHATVSKDGQATLTCIVHF